MHTDLSESVGGELGSFSLQWALDGGRNGWEGGCVLPASMHSIHPDDVVIINKLFLTIAQI